MTSTSRRTVLTGVVAALPLLSGCSDPGTTIRLEPLDVRVVGAAAADGWTWDLAFDLEYELRGLDEDDGLYGVMAHLLDARGEERARTNLGDLAWNDLSAAERETGEYEDGVEYYHGSRRERVSAEAKAFPRWLVFTADRAVGSGVWLDVSVFGARCGWVPTADDSTDRKTNGTADSTDDAAAARDRTGAERDRSVGEDENATELAIRSERIELPADAWERVRLERYESFPPTAVVPTPWNASTNGGRPTDSSRRAD